MSNTDHPRYNGTHRAGHARRSYEERGQGNYVAYGTPKQRILATPRLERLTIAEGLAEYQAEQEDRAIAQDGLRECLDTPIIGYFQRQDLLGVTLHEPVPHTTETPRKLQGMAMVATLDEGMPATVRRDLSWVPLAATGKRRAAKHQFSRTSAPVMASWTRTIDA